MPMPMSCMLPVNVPFHCRCLRTSEIAIGTAEGPFPSVGPLMLDQVILLGKYLETHHTLMGLMAITVQGSRTLQQRNHTFKLFFIFVSFFYIKSLMNCEIPLLHIKNKQYPLFSTQFRLRYTDRKGNCLFLSFSFSIHCRTE